MTSELPTRHEILSPPSMSEALGYAHAVLPASGKTLYLGGQGATGPDGRVIGESLVEQFDIAAGNVATVLESAGGSPQDLVAMWIYVTDGSEYRSWRFDIGRVYRRHFGRHYVASGLFVVSELWDVKAKVELVCTAVVPDAVKAENPL